MDWTNGRTRGIRGTLRRSTSNTGPSLTDRGPEASARAKPCGQTGGPSGWERALRRVGALAGIFLLAVAVGCGGNSGPDTSRLGIQAVAAPGVNPQSWNWIQARVHVDGGESPQPVCTAYQAGTQQLLTLPAVPFGANFDVELLAYQANEPCGGPPLARGCTGPVRIATNDAPRTLVVRLAPIGPFAPSVPPTGSNSGTPVPRLGASATVLPDGRVVIIGGMKIADTTDNPQKAERPWDVLGDNVIQLYDTVEIYHPDTGQLETLETAPDSAQTLFFPRAYHNAVYLPGSGLIAVVGGYQQAAPGAPIEPSKSIELFDPQSKVFLDHALVNAMNAPHARGTTTLLTYAGGLEFLLVAGGEGDGASVVEVVDVSRNNLLANKAGPIQTFALPTPRWAHVAALVKGSAAIGGVRRVFFIGGLTKDPNTGAVAPTPLIDVFKADQNDPWPGNSPGFVVMPGQPAPAGLKEARFEHNVVVVEPETGGLKPGMYVIGGFKDAQRMHAVGHIEILDLDTGGECDQSGQFPCAPPEFSLSNPRGLAQAVVFPTGQILVAGGMRRNADGSVSMIDKNELITLVANPALGGNVEQPVVLEGTMVTTRFAFNLVATPQCIAVAFGGLTELANSLRMVGADTAHVPIEFTSVNPDIIQP